jgi:hypothetical protein
MYIQCKLRFLNCRIITKWRGALLSDTVSSRTQALGPYPTITFGTTGQQLPSRPSFLSSVPKFNHRPARRRWSTNSAAVRAPDPTSPVAAAAAAARPSTLMSASSPTAAPPHRRGPRLTTTSQHLPHRPASRPPPPPPRRPPHRVIPSSRTRYWLLGR